MLNTFRELLQFHPDSLSDGDHEVIGQVFAIDALTDPKGLVS
ncbi:hypothetical protein [Trinickia sp. EG282A]